MDPRVREDDSVGAGGMRSWGNTPGRPKPVIPAPGMESKGDVCNTSPVLNRALFTQVTHQIRAINAFYPLLQ